MKISTDKSKEYQAVVQERMPKSKVFSQLVRAFLVGGLICCVGEGVRQIAQTYLSMDEKGVSAFVSIVMIFLGSLLTGLGVYDKLGKFAGAGSVVPITGFANSIVAPAMEHKVEGYVLGVGAKLFSIAGPVLVYGTIASMIVGIIALIVE
ncbi:MAG: stage V sporulation protein AC [Clostridia bacterium]|nr:stage V sporulation protein AC [Clostridia bacterium]